MSLPPDQPGRAPSTTRTTRTVRTPVQTATLLVASTFLVVGVLGFIPGITTNYSSMTFASHHSRAMLLGVFQVSILHNIVHLLFGVVGLAAIRRVSSSSTYLVVGGAIYFLLFIYGLIVGEESTANVVPVNTADDVLHVVLGVGMIALAGSLGPRSVQRVEEAERD